MKRLFALLVALIGYAVTLSAEEGGKQTTKVPFGDPFILLHEGTYYAYGTNSDQGILVYTSDNLKDWYYPDRRTEPLVALHKDDVWLPMNISAWR